MGTKKLDEALTAITRPPIRRLFLDIETSPNVVYSWRVGHKISINYENIVQERAIICVGYKWQDKPVRCITWDRGDDKGLLTEIVPIMESATEIVAHYGDRFDMPWLRARAAYHKIPISPYLKTIDTKAQASRGFYFNSNRLNYLSQFLQLGAKIETDFDLWKSVLAGDEKALSQMVAYCKKDVVLLEKVFLRLESYNKPKTHYGVAAGRQRSDCPRCGSEDTMRIGKRVTGMGTANPLMRCKSCKGEFLISAAEAAKRGL